MTIETYIQAAASLYLLTAVAFTTARGNLNRLLFKLTPLVLGLALGALSFARFMGWPV